MMDSQQLRVRLFLAVIVGVFFVLALRLVQLQLVDASAYTGESQSNAVREMRVQPARGVIYDRHGELIVDNEPSYTILITPRYFDSDRTELLAELLEVPDSVVTARLEEAQQWSGFRPSRSFRNVPFEAFSRVQENIYRLPGVTYEVEQRRRYRSEARASHALGYVREITRAELERLQPENYRQGDLVGKSGLEQHYEPYLRGRSGHEFKVVNIHGMEVEPYQDGAEDVSPEAGYNLHLSLDAGVQALAESLFVNKRGAAVALDPNNGEILAMVSMPDYDPSVFSSSMDSETWQYLTSSTERPMFNRSTMMRMVPGSTWKPFMALMALEEGLITPHSTIRCSGGYRLGQRVFHDHNNEAHGAINVQDALKHSCNTFFYSLMMDTDLSSWSQWADRFGFGSSLSLDVGQQSNSLIPDSSYYDQTYPHGWTSGSTIILGIGQGDMLVTPMELARYTAALANGGTLYHPRMVRRMEHPETDEVIEPEVPEPEHIPVAEEHFETVRTGMRQVMNEGTAEYVQIPGIESGGKTGTAENPHGDNHSIFIMFAPYEDPEIAVAVMVENAGYGATVAAPIASMMAEMYLTGEIAETWEREFHIERLMNELESAPLQSGEGVELVGPAEDQ